MNHLQIPWGGSRNSGSIAPSLCNNPPTPEWGKSFVGRYFFHKYLADNKNTL